jgi:hypothetical protein
MQQLADRKPEIAVSHAGVLFLLENMGVKLSRPHYGVVHGNSERAFTPVGEGQQTSATMPQKAPILSTTAYMSQKVPIPSTAAYTYRKPTPPLALAPVAPPPLPVHPTPLGHVQQRSQAEKLSHLTDPTLFYDPLFRRDVSDYMHHGQTVPFRRPAKFSSPYNPADDDLMVWKQRLAQQIARGGKGGKKSKENTGLQDEASKSDEKRVKEINDMGNDMTPGGEFGGKLLGYKPLDDWQEDPGSVQKGTEKY